MSPPKPLPARPNLEHLKDQAGDLRRAFARADAVARARVAAVEPVQSSLSTTHPVLSATQALLVIAREYGYDSWPALTHAIKEAPMSTNHPLMQLDELGLEPGDLAKIRSAMGAARGLMLFVGPQGSGKGVALEVVNRTLAGGVPGGKAPQVPSAGDLDGFIEVDQALQAAANGQLVLAALPTFDAASTIPQLIAMRHPAKGTGWAAGFLADTISLIVAQRLMRKICEGCKAPLAYTAAEYRRWNVAAGELDGIPLYRGKGCSVCDGSGYKGRTAVFEVMPLSAHLKELVRNNAGAKDLRDAAEVEGVRPLYPSALNKVKAGITTIEELAGMGLDHAGGKPVNARAATDVTRNVHLFTTRFAAMMRSGLPILDALKIGAESVQDKAFAQVIMDIRGKLREGEDFGSHLKGHLPYFDAMYIYMVSVGQETGKLDEMLEWLARYQESGGAFGQMHATIRQIEIMIRAGLPLPQAVAIAGELAPDAALKAALAQISEDVKAGANFPEALAKHPTVFDGFIIGMVKAGDAGGNLDEVLLRVATTLERTETFSRSAAP